MAGSEEQLKQAAADYLGLLPEEIKHLQLQRRSLDARHGNIRVRIKAQAWVDELPPATNFSTEYPQVDQGERVVIIGAGPAGLFAALRLIEEGRKPIVIERGKDVQARRRDLAVLNRDHIVNPNSNYCFGEGGAGTYSDGKLYTRSKKRGDVERILKILVAHGADEDILIDAHPHIGTNKLPKLIVAVRESILNAGGEIHFDTRMTDLVVEDQEVKGIIDQHNQFHEAKAVILATGHSARDVFELLHRKNILIEVKPFALGVRVEHSQELIDRLQYHQPNRGEYLPPASYSLVHQANNRGVYSFCMCPGGIIAPCATDQEEIVTNGWSPSKRNNPYANSGIVVSVEEKDLKKFRSAGALAALRFQQSVERKAWQAGGERQSAPAQRLVDFVEGKVSSTLPDCSYQPGLVSTQLSEVLPGFISATLKEGFKAFGKKMKGYFTNDALIVGVESRTSSPVRIPRDRETLEHPQIKGLYPCGEGAGFAGGIVSAAIDGERCAEKASTFLKK